MAQAIGFVALRSIDAGEELFSTYGIDDGGQRWFQDRGLTLVVDSRLCVTEEWNCLRRRQEKILFQGLCWIWTTKLERSNNGQALSPDDHASRTSSIHSAWLLMIIQ
jgi:hypothetical protein